MYLKLFGLNEKPFHITPNPRFIFLSKNHKEAFAHLLYGVRQRVGFLSLIGEVGTGKTTVLRTLLRQLEQSNFQVALIFNPCLSELELLQAIHREFSIEIQDEKPNLASLHDSLNKFLLEQRKQGRTVVLVVDEAQNLSPKVLEQLRLLSNLETETDKLLQLVIVGQPELDDILERHELRQLKQRLTVRYRLKNMDAEDTGAYIRHRLKVAGHTKGRIFSDKALQQIYRLTGGLPRLINILCDRALLVAYSQEHSKVDHLIVREAQSELAGQEPLKTRPWGKIAIFVTMVSAVAVGLLLPTDLIHIEKNREPAAIKISTTTIPISTPVEVAPTPTVEPLVNPQILSDIKQVIASQDESGSGLVAVNELLQSWERPVLKAFPATQAHPIAAALRSRNLSTIRFSGSRSQLLAFDSPAILTIVLPNMVGKRYLALLGSEGDKVYTVPKLTEDGWINVNYLDQIWFGKALIPWSNFNDLPFLDRPGTKSSGVKRTQKLLTKAGYTQLALSGVYDEETISAVSDLQQNNGLAPDGRIGAQTLLQLYKQAGQEIPKLGRGEL